MAIGVEDLAGLDISDVATTEQIGPVTPGEVLREELLVPLGLSGRALARELGAPSNRITEIVTGAGRFRRKQLSCLPSVLARRRSSG